MRHVCVSVAAITMVVVMVCARTRPNAELEGLFLMFGLVLAIPTAAFTFAAVRTVRSSFKEPPEGSGCAAALGATEAALGLAFVAGVAVSGAPGNSPLIRPAVILLVLGLTSVGLAVVRARQTHRTAAIG